MTCFTREERLLLLEANMTNTMLLEGLDCLSHADSFHQGLYYQAFYSLAIGIERLLKLIKIDQYRVQFDGKFPKNLELKKMGHHIEEMIREIAPELYQEEIEAQVIGFLNRFSLQTRYYNLDALNGKESLFLEPLEDWRKIEMEIGQKYCRTYPKIRNQRVLGQLIDQTADVYLLGMSEQMICSSNQMLEEFFFDQNVHGYVVLVVFRMIQTLASSLTCLEQKHHLYPYLWEVFRMIRGSYTDSEVRHRKNWRNLME